MIANTEEAGNPGGYAGNYEKDETVKVQWTQDGKAFVDLRDLGPSEVLVMANRA